jgi:rhodanese-related sulfurtransferase
MFQFKLLLFAFPLFVLTAEAQHPFKYDNTVYKAVYLNEAFSLMDTMQNYLLLDVRSPGEYADTSRGTVSNIGRIKGSVNISIDSIPAHLEELKNYINRPVFVYCSHSQRSRRVSKLLADNGFKKVYNINGGMTQLNEMDAARFPEKNKYMITNLDYKNIASTEAFHLINDTASIVIIDIRTAQEFKGIDSLVQNNIGRLKNAINIPQADFESKFDSYRISNNRPVLLYDQRGINSMDVVYVLRAKGFTRIYNLFEGFEVFISDHRLDKTQLSELIVDPAVYNIVDPKGFMDLLKEPNIIILDTRPIEEFNNKARMAYMNLGHIKGAINITSPDSVEMIIRVKDKSKVFLIYGSGSDKAAIICRKLVKDGFQNVNLLNHGLYNFVWSTANVEDCKSGRDFLTDHEGLY